jgi:hypothetical protein
MTISGRNITARYNLDDLFGNIPPNPLVAVISKGFSIRSVRPTFSSATIFETVRVTPQAGNNIYAWAANEISGRAASWPRDFVVSIA